MNSNRYGSPLFKEIHSQATSPQLTTRYTADVDARCQILELKLKEAQERECNLKKLNEQIMQAMENVHHRSDNTKEIQILSDRYQKEVRQLKSNFQEQINTLYQQNQQLKEDAEQEHQSHAQEVASMRIQLECEIQRCNDTTSTKREELQQTNQIVDRMKSDNLRERQEWAKETKSALENMKQIQEYEKNILRMTVQQLQAVQESELVEKQTLMDAMKELRDKYENNQKYLLDSMSSFHQQHSSFMTQNYQQSLSMQIKDQELKQREVNIETDKNKIEGKINEQNEQNKQLQQRVKLLQVQQNEKDLKYQESRTELTKKISLEKKKADSMQDAAQRLKDDYQKKSTVLLQETLSKDSKIKNYQSQINKLRVRCDHNNMADSYRKCDDDTTPFESNRYRVTQHNSQEKDSTRVTPLEVKSHHRSKQNSQDLTSQSKHRSNKSHGKSHMSINLFPLSTTKSEFKDNLVSESVVQSIHQNTQEAQGKPVYSWDATLKHSDQPPIEICRNMAKIDTNQRSIHDLQTNENGAKFLIPQGIQKIPLSQTKQSNTNRSNKSIKDKENTFYFK